MLSGKALSMSQRIVRRPFRRGFGIVQSRSGDGSPRQSHARLAFGPCNKAFDEYQATLVYLGLAKPAGALESGLTYRQRGPRLRSSSFGVAGPERSSSFGVAGFQ
jgi:hypothetical protein